MNCPKCGNAVSRVGSCLNCVCGWTSLDSPETASDEAFRRQQAQQVTDVNRLFAQLESDPCPKCGAGNLSKIGQRATCAACGWTGEREHAREPEMFGIPKRQRISDAVTRAEPNITHSAHGFTDRSGLETFSANQYKPACPKCGSPNLSRVGERQSCGNCGWTNQTPATVTARPGKQQKRAAAVLRADLG